MKRDQARGKLCALAICGLLVGCDSVFGSFLVYPDAGDSDAGGKPGYCGDPALVLCLRFDQGLTDDGPKRFSPLDPPPDVAIVNDAERGMVGQFGSTAAPKPFRLPHNQAWELDQFSFDAWVFPDKEIQSRVGVLDRSLRFGIFLYPQSTTTLWMACGIHNALVSGSSVPIGQWSHIACVASDSRIDIYLNGQITNSATLFNATPVAQTIETFVGAKEPEGNQAFIGKIDDLRMFKRLRTAAEIEADASRKPMQQ